MFLEALVGAAGRSGSVADLPESVEGLVTSQIDRLDPADRTVLRYAAVLGIVVDEEALVRLLDDHAERPRDGCLDRLSGFLRARGSRPAAVPTRADARRRLRGPAVPPAATVLHEQVGQAIEASSAIARSQCELLSLHFFHARSHDKAWTYSLLAGERARAKYAHGEAIDFFARAVESARRERTVAGASWRDVLELLGDSRSSSALPRTPPRPTPQARRHCGATPCASPASSRRRSGSTSGCAGHPLPAADLTRPARAGGQDGPPARGPLPARPQYAFSRFTQGRVDDALHWAERRRPSGGGSRTRTRSPMPTRADLHLPTSGAQEPLPYGRLALQVYKELGDLREPGHSAEQPGASGLRGRPVERGSGEFQRATASSAASVTRRTEANAIYNQAELLVRQGRFAEAVPAAAGRRCGSRARSRTRSWSLWRRGRRLG